MDPPFFEKRERAPQRAMEQFPCPLELTAASALLLLSATPPSLSPSVFDFVDEDSLEEPKQSKSCSGSLALSYSKNSSSSSITSDVSSEEIRARTKKIASVPRHYEMKLKVVRKSRTKVYWSAGCQNISSGKTASTTSHGSEFTETSSCLSSGSTADSSARSRYVTGSPQKLAVVLEERWWRSSVGSTHIRGRAEAILKMLSGGCLSEVRIRQVLGDSPDTSKALRMLLKQEKVKRSGTGGRQDPYKYMIAA